MPLKLVKGMRSRTKVLMLLVAGLVPACTPSLPLSNDTPPLLLAPATVAGVSDGRGRFREVLCAVDAVRNYYPDRRCGALLHTLNGEPGPTGKPVALGPARIKLRIRIVPGIFGECTEKYATPFRDAVDPWPGKGYTLPDGFEVAAFRVSGRASSAHNAKLIANQITEMNLQPNERLVLIGHSKGMSDILELIGTEGKAGAQRVVPSGSAIVSLAGVVAGTPIADQGEGAFWRLRNIPWPTCAPEDGGGVTSLTRRYRLNFLAAHPLPTDLRYYSLAAYTRRSNISSGLKATHAALAKIDARNDGNVIFHDSIIPGSKVLGYLDADHWSVAMPFEIYAPTFNRLVASRNHFPRVVLLEAIARVIEEDYVDREAASGHALTSP